MPNGIESTLVEIERMLAEVRKPRKPKVKPAVIPEPGEPVEEEGEGLQWIPGLQRRLAAGETVFFTPAVAKSMGLEVDIALDWMLKVTPGKNGDAPTFSYLSPEGREVQPEDILEVMEGPRKGEWAEAVGQVWDYEKGEFVRASAEQIAAREAWPAEIAPEKMTPEEYIEREKAIWQERAALFEEIYPELFEPFTEEQKPDIAREFQDMLARDVKAQEQFLETVWDIGRTPQTESLLRALLPRVTEEDLIEFFGRAIVDLTAEASNLVKEVFPEITTGEGFLSLVENNPDEFIERMQLGGRTKAKQDLLGTMGLDWDEINEVFEVQKLVVPVEGVEQELTVHMATGRAFDQSGKLVGTYDIITREFNKATTADRVKEFVNTWSFASVSGVEKGKQFFLGILPQLLFRDQSSIERKIHGDAWADETNRRNKNTRDLLRSIAAESQRDYEDWVSKHPELQPSPIYEEGAYKHPELWSDPNWWAYEVASMAPVTLTALAVGAAATLLTGGNLVAGAAAAGLTFGPVETQAVKEDLLAEGVPEDQASQLAALVGVPIVLTEFAGTFLQFTRFLPQIRAMFRREAAKQIAKLTARQLAKKGVTTFTILQFTETTEEVIQQALGNAAVIMAGKDRSLFEGIPELIPKVTAGMLPFSLIGTGVSLVRVSPSVTRDLSDAQLKAQGFMQDPENVGEWYQQVDARTAEPIEVPVAPVPKEAPAVPAVPEVVPPEVTPAMKEQLRETTGWSRARVEKLTPAEAYEMLGMPLPGIPKVEAVPPPVISKFTEIAPIEFNKAIDKAPRQEFLTRYTPEELEGSKLFLSEDKLVGYAIKPDGELFNIFNASGVMGAGQEAMVQGIAKGATTLNCMRGWLSDYYSDFGFVEVRSEKWNEAFAPEVWDYTKYGRPDIIWMEYPEGGTRNADIIRESYRVAGDRRLAVLRRGEGPPAPPRAEIGRPGRRAVPVGEPRVIEAPVRVPAEPVVAPEVVEAPPAVPEVVPEVDVEVRRQLDELSKMARIWATKLADREQTKVSLSKFVRETLPPPVRGRYIAAVARVQTDAQLQKQIARVQEFAEQNAQKVLKAEIAKEIKKTQAKVKQHILTGKFTPETQRMLDTIRHNLDLPRAQALDKVASNFDRYNKDEISWEEMHKENEALNFVGIKEMTSAELMETLDYIKVLKVLGKSERQAKREAYIEKITSVRGDVVDTASGGRGPAKGIYAIPQSEWQATKSFLDKVINWMYNWDSLLDKISKFKKDLPFKSPISVFGARVHRARHLQHSIQQEAQSTAIKGLEGIYKTKNRHQLNRILNGWKHEMITLGEFELAAVEGVEERVVKTIRMTKGQMMTMYNLMKDPTLDSTFRQTMRWTDEIMDAVRTNLTAEEKAYADFAMDFFKNDPDIGYDAINKVYSDIYAVDLSNNPYYFPAFRDMESQIHEEVLTFREAGGYASVLNGSLKVRVRNIRALKFSDITDVISSHITKQAHFIAWGHTMRDMRAVFGNKEVRETIEQYHGGHIMGEITKNLNDMARDGVERQQFGFIADYLRGNFAKAILGIKGSLLLKQIPSVFAYMTEMPIGDFVTGVQNYWHNPVENYRFMLKRSPYLRERFGAGFERDVHFANMKKPADFLSGRKPVKGYITENVKFGDKFAVMQGMWAKMLAELKAMGVTVKTATEPQITEAMQAAEDLTNRTQPAFDIETLAPLQRGGPWVKLLTMFQTQPGQYFRVIGNNFRNFQHHRGTRTNALKNIVLVWIILPCLWQLIADGFQWKEEHQYRAMILGQLNWILIVSQLSRSAYDWAVGEPFDYMASPVMASVRDFLFGIGKVRKIALQGKDPYVDISMDDVIGAVEFFGKSIGQVLGYPTPFLVQVERAQREYIQKAKEEGEDIEAIEVGKRLIFSAWALEPPKQSTREKAQEVSDKLGELIKEVDEVRAEYGLPGEYYGMKAAGSKFKSVFAHTLLSDITEENGFDKLAVAWAEMEIARQTHADLLPNIPLYKINTDPMEGLTIVKLHQLWEARSRLTRLPEIVEFDKTWSDVHVEHGNVTRQQYSLLVKYLETPDEEKKQFVEDHPELKVNPRSEWLRANPLDNARLALWGQAKILTLEAYNEFIKLVKELDIPDDAIPELILPPKTSIDTHFAYEGMVDEGTHGSVEADLLLLKDHLAAKEAGVESYAEWHDLQVSDKPVEYLQLRVDNQELYDKLDEAREIEDEVDKEKAIEKVRATPVGDETFHDIERRVDAMGQGTMEAPVDPEVVNAYVEHMQIVDETSGNSAEAKLNRYDNPDLNEYLMNEDYHGEQAAEPLDEDKEYLDNYLVPRWRLEVKNRTKDEEYNAIDPDAKNPETGIRLRDEWLALPENDEYRKDRRRDEAYEMKHSITDFRFPAGMVEAYVTYAEYGVKGKRQERFLVENPQFAQALYDAGELADFPKAKDVPAVQYDDIYDRYPKQFDKIAGLGNPESIHFIETGEEDPETGRTPREQAAYELRFSPDGKLTDFGMAEIRRDGYGIFVPEKYIDRFVEFDSLRVEKGQVDYPDGMTWYGDEWYLFDHPLFYRDIYIELFGLDEIGFVPHSKWRGFWEDWTELDFQYEGASDRKQPEFYIEDEDKREATREQLLIDNPEYRQDRKKRAALLLKLPDNYLDDYASFYEIPFTDKAKSLDPFYEEYPNEPYYEDDWYLKEHPEFYQAMLALRDKDGDPIWLPRKGFDKVPTREVHALYKEYLDEIKGKPREDFRWEHRDLDAWLLLTDKVTVSITEKRRRAALTPHERMLEEMAEIEERLKR